MGEPRFLVSELIAALSLLPADATVRAIRALATDDSIQIAAHDYRDPGDSAFPAAMEAGAAANRALPLDNREVTP